MSIGLEWLAVVVVIWIAWRFGLWQGRRQGLAGRVFAYLYDKGQRL